MNKGNSNNNRNNDNDKNSVYCIPVFLPPWLRLVPIFCLLIFNNLHESDIRRNDARHDGEKDKH